MATQATDEFPGPLQRRHFAEIMGAIFALSTFLVVYWAIFD
jgi:hypothetical protein